MSHPDTPITLLVHDGELTDLHVMLEELETPFVARCGALEPEDREVPWDLIIATPQRLLALPFQAVGSSQQHIAICDQDSRTLRNSLRRAGIGLMIRRPVHPAVLRALLLHALYRGPEKRRLPRISIGAPVRYRTTWRQQSAILADLSLGGCRLFARQRPDRGKAFTLLLPAKLTGGRPLSLKARVLRTGPAEAQPAGTTAIIARFARPGASALSRLKAILQAHASGPAMIETATAPRSTASPTTQLSATPPHQEAPEQPVSCRDRRTDTRHTVDRRVIALKDEASRVLVGRDISLGGMRVDATSRLSVGQTLRIAIHVNGSDAPLVVVMQVHRDDGEHGLALRFVALSGEAKHVLGETIERLPVLEPGEDERDRGYIVSEILEVQNG